MPSVASPHWRNGLDKAIAVLRHEPKELQEKLGIEFEQGVDDLDFLVQARIDSPSGKRFALVRHDRSPRPGTEVLTRESSNELAEDLVDVLKTLQLDLTDVTWTHPRILIRSATLAATASDDARRPFDAADTERAIATLYEILSAISHFHWEVDTLGSTHLKIDFAHLFATCMPAEDFAAQAAALQKALEVFDASRLSSLRDTLEISLETLRELLKTHRP